MEQIFIRLQRSQLLQQNNIPNKLIMIRINRNHFILTNINILHLPRLAPSDQNIFKILRNHHHIHKIFHIEKFIQSTLMHPFHKPPRVLPIPQLKHLNNLPTSNRNTLHRINNHNLIYQTLLSKLYSKHLPKKYTKKMLIHPLIFKKF